MIDYWGDIATSVFGGTGRARLRKNSRRIGRNILLRIPAILVTKHDVLERLI
jgi:hypothetical protein